MSGQMEIFPPRWRPPDFDESKLTTEERAVYLVMQFHEGRPQAMKIEYLAMKVGRSDRDVRNILKHLTEKHGVAIAATTSPPYGVYLVETAEELEEYCRQIHSRAMSLLTREAVLKRQHLGELLGQMRMDEAGSAEHG